MVTTSDLVLCPGVIIYLSMSEKQQDHQSDTRDCNPGGLSSREARRRLEQYGQNVIAKTKHISGIQAYLARFKNPLVLILLLAAGISFFMGEIASGTIITVIILISTSLDFANTYRSEKAVSDLERSVHTKAMVLRDGKPRQLDVACLVPGDVVAVQAGSIIPADGKVISSNSLLVDESSLTGESYPVAKQPGDQIYMGSSVASGSGELCLTATGTKTEFAHIATSLNHGGNTSEFELELARFSGLITHLTLGLVIFILVINILFQRSPAQSLLFAIALAVGLTPELLPLIMTINLTKGSLRMSKKGVIVKKLAAMQNFGAMDILCTDKTGTLTENHISVAKTQDFNRTECRKIIELAHTVCQLSSSYKSPLDTAIISHHQAKLTGTQLIRELPFDFERKRESVIVSQADQLTMITKGAPDSLFPIISRYRDKNGAARHLSPLLLDRLRADYQELSRQGLRTLLIATKSLETKDEYQTKDESDLTFEGFVCFTDPAKKSAAKSLRDLNQNNIRVKIISGDDPLVCQRVAHDLGLEVTKVLTGDQINRLNNLQLAKIVDRTSIFARVNPSEKLRIIKALRQQGHVVGYMGDGINDAPSLKAADIGISVNNAVEVARDAADIILLGKSLRYLNDGVVEGRRTFVNTAKYLKMSLSSNFGNMISMAGASLFLPFLPMTAPQILLNNLLYDSSQFALPSDNVDLVQLEKPRQMNIKSLKEFMLVFGLISSLFDFITFAILKLVFNSTAAGFQTYWFIESLVTQTLVVLIIRSPRAFTKSLPSKPLLASIAGVILIALAIIFSPLGRYFGFVQPTLAPMLVISLITLSYLVVVRIVSLLMVRHNELIK